MGQARAKIQLRNRTLSLHCFCSDTGSLWDGAAVGGLGFLMVEMQWALENQFLQENFQPSGCLFVIEKTDGVCSLKNFKQPSKQMW